MPRRTFNSILEEDGLSGRLLEVVNKCYSLAQVCDHYGYFNNGRNTGTVKKVLIQLGIDFTHFTPSGFPRREEERDCPVCGKKFTVTNTNWEKTTCSHGCANTFFRSGNNAGGYSGGVYSGKSAFKKAFPIQKCAVCEEVEVIDFHHVDQDRSNNAISNIIPLCPTHHAYVHRDKLDLILDKLEDFFKSRPDIYE